MHSTGKVRTFWLIVTNSKHCCVGEDVVLRLELGLDLD